MEDDDDEMMGESLTNSTDSAAGNSTDGIDTSSANPELGQEGAGDLQINQLLSARIQALNSA